MSVVVASVAARFSRPCHGRRDASALGLHGVDNGRMHFADLAAEDHGATALRCACALERRGVSHHEIAVDDLEDGERP